MAKYVLGPREFPSKAAAKAAFRAILNDHPDDIPLRGDAAELVTLLIHDGRHPDTVEKIGPGITDIVVRRCDYGTRGFWLRHVDATSVDFSYLTALDGAPSPERAARAALRWEIEDQIAEFRSGRLHLVAQGLISCELCGRPVNRDAVHVDHAEPTFDELARRFAEAVGGWAVLAIECVGATGRQLVDRGHAHVWQVFHQQTARLRITHPRCNLTRKAAS